MLKLVPVMYELGIACGMYGLCVLNVEVVLVDIVLVDRNVMDSSRFY